MVFVLQNSLVNIFLSLDRNRISVTRLNTTWPIFFLFAAAVFFGHVTVCTNGGAGSVLCSCSAGSICLQLTTVVILYLKVILLLDFLLKGDITAYICQVTVCMIIGRQ